MRTGVLRGSLAARPGPPPERRASSRCAWARRACALLRKVFGPYQQPRARRVVRSIRGALLREREGFRITRLVGAAAQTPDNCREGHRCLRRPAYVARPTPRWDGEATR